MDHTLWKNTFCLVKAKSRIDISFYELPGHLKYLGLDTRDTGT